jgi:hypothetical protein
VTVLVAWCCFAAGVLVVNLVVYVSTFLATDPMAKWPGILFIDAFVMFPPFGAAAYYSWRFGGTGQGSSQRVVNSRPRWLRVLTGVLFAFAIVNFMLFLLLGRGGQPMERDGKYVLDSHGRTLRELSEPEYHRMQAYMLRGFSSLYMFLSSGALMFLVGAARLRRSGDGAGQGGEGHSGVTMWRVH